LKVRRIPDEWRSSILVPVCKNKVDGKLCTNYRALKLLCHTMKLWERIIDSRIEEETEILGNQFKFMQGKSTTDAIFIIRQVMEN
jgi:hypothetical protein